VSSLAQNPVAKEVFASVLALRLCVLAVETGKMTCCSCFAGIGGSSEYKGVALSKLIKNKDIEGAANLFQFLQVDKAVQATSLVLAIRTVVTAGDPDEQLENGSYALHEAAKCNQAKLCRELVHAGATLTKTDKQGRTAAECAVQKKNKDCIRFLNRDASEIGTSQFIDGLNFVQKVEIFKSLHREDYPALAAAFKTRSYSTGEAIIRQGEVGKQFFVIKSGQAAVFVTPENGGDPVKVNTLAEGDYFGEQALLSDKPRNATIKAVQPVQAKVLDRKDFEALGLKRRLHFKKRRAVFDIDGGNEKIAGTTRAKSPTEIAFIVKAMQANAHLGLLLPSNKVDLEKIAESANHLKAIAGTDIIVEGDLESDNFYILESGEIIVRKNGKQVTEYTESGASFGELALIHRAPRAATVHCEKNAIFWAIPRNALRTVTQAPLKKKLEGYAKTLDGFDFLKHVSKEDKRTLADALIETLYHQGDYIITQGEEGSTFYILSEGKLSVEIDKKRIGSLEASSRKSECFGEKALLDDEPRAASIKCESATVRVLALDRRDFCAIVQKEVSKHAYHGREMVEYKLQDLKYVGLLGCGGFGKVTLVRCSTVNTTFALKALSKGHVLRHHQEKSIMSEKEIMKMTHSPFLVRLAATFNGPQHLYFLMEVAMGGEMFETYQRENFYGSEKHAQFYVACVIRAFAHLHERKIVYRDLKPENLLLDAKGYCKVTDFGLAKFVIGHTYTTCGTPDYFAPELVAATGHTLAVDWWTLGVLVYELMCGEAPFQADDNMSIFKNVAKGIDKVKFPSKDPWTNLVKSLCKKDPAERLPMRSGGVRNLEEHKWFTGGKFKWEDLNSRKMVAPYLPRLKGSDDMANFGASEEDSPPEIRYTDPRNGWDANFADPWGPKVFD